MIFVNLLKCNDCTIKRVFFVQMPVIKRFNNSVLRINFKDHAPPHFHIVMNDGRDVWVKIDTLEIIHGKIAQREIAEALAWAATQHSFLLAKFEELQE